MKIDFYLRFYTQPGGSIWLSGNWAVLGGGDPEKAFPLQYVNGEFWHASLLLEQFPADPLHYHYMLKGEDGSLTEEGGNDKLIAPPAPEIEEVQAIDTWNYAGEFENVFYTSPFQEVLLPRHKAGKKSRNKGTFTHLFRVKAPLLGEEEVVCLLGNGTALHDWNEEDPLLLAPEGAWWSVPLDLPRESFPIDY
jgi:4-alpha-glucanotransferase